MDESQQKKSSSVAAAAAVNIDGYLRNASKRLRIPSASGGRGTRRKLAMVTAANIERSPQQLILETKSEGEINNNNNNNNNIVDMDDDEWDEVILPNSNNNNNIGTMGVKKDEEKIKGELAVLHALKSDIGMNMTTVNNNNIKAEAIQIDNDENNNNKNDENNIIDNDPLIQRMMEGTRPPLADTPMRRWRQHDPVYERMLEQQELLAAQRRSERIRRAAEGISILIFALQRSKLIVQESRHPKLVRRLLKIQIKENNNTKCFPLINAVQKAKEFYNQAINPINKNPTLTPSWVTASKDTIKNYTSSSIMSLINGINSVFSLGDNLDNSILYNWAYPIKPKYFFNILSKPNLSINSIDNKIILPHSLYLCIAFISLATVSGISCRLVIAMRKEREKKVLNNNNHNESNNNNVNENDTNETKPKEMMTLFLPRTKKQQQQKKNNNNNEQEERLTQKLPSSCFWIEVWCPQRECFISVNPCEGCTTLWGAPYTFSVGGNIAVDVTPRYSIKYSSAYSHRWGRCDQYRFFWKNLKWDDNREASEVILDSFRKDLTSETKKQLEREKKQLHSLTYAEEVPKTITALQKHPLFVLESELARHEGVYPKDNSTIVGSVKGHIVYKRSAIVNLRSRDGWLRTGRCVKSEEEEKPYKLVPPPASRPFALPSSFFGVWQTIPFEPQPIRSDGSIPLHGRTHWYILLDKPAPKGLIHIQKVSIARVARRVEVEFGLAVMGFQRRRLDERRFAHWEAIINGIVVKETDAPNLLHAYEEWKQLTEEQESAKRKQRSNRWWLHFVQRMLSMQRVREQYLKGAMHGVLTSR